ncbi:MAG: hypothetical protein JNL10_01875 [Verrucomicrobiales bacterium]|nr:hypothetical protein [Verrucomicrobiales bacterium]
MTRRRIGRAGAAVLLLGVLSMGAGCSTAPTFPPVDLSEAGWKVRELPAVWRPRRGAPELTGELLVAVNGVSRLVQFSKQGMPVLTAQVSTNGWRVSSALQAGSHTGRLPAPRQVLWFLIDGSPPKTGIQTPWRLENPGPGGGWTLSNPRTGESLETAPVPP